MFVGRRGVPAYSIVGPLTITTNGGIMVRKEVIRAVNNWRDWSNDDDGEDGPQRKRRLFIDMSVDRRDAIHVVGSLEWILPQECIGSIPWKTELRLCDDEISDEALQVFCNYLQETCHLRELFLSDLPREQVRRLLEALHFNTSVTTLHIRALRGDDGGLWIANLLQQKRNFEALYFEQCSFPIFPFPRHGLTFLHTLVFRSSQVGDDGVRLILHAFLMDGGCYVLKELDLSFNHITSIGLYLLATLIPVALPSLEKLNLASNQRLFGNQKTTRLFADGMFLSRGTSLKELYIDRCGDCTPIIKACETNDTLEVLDITCEDIDHHHQSIRNQLVESMPKMKGIQRLIYHFELFTRDNQPLLMTSLVKNTSIVHITSNTETRPSITPILQRNRHLAHIRCCIGNAESSIANFPWTRVLAKAGQGSQSATPVFTILCDRLATWVHPAQAAALTPTPIIQVHSTMRDDNVVTTSITKKGNDTPSKELLVSSGYRERPTRGHMRMMIRQSHEQIIKKQVQK